MLNSDWQPSSFRNSEQISCAKQINLGPRKNFHRVVTTAIHHQHHYQRLLWPLVCRKEGNMLRRVFPLNFGHRIGLYSMLRDNSNCREEVFVKEFLKGGNRCSQTKN